MIARPQGGFAQSSSFLLARSLAARFPFREHLRGIVDHLFFIEVGAAGSQYLLVPEPLTFGTTWSGRIGSPLVTWPRAATSLRPSGRTRRGSRQSMFCLQQRPAS
jgi:hypothetical protein